MMNFVLVSSALHFIWKLIWLYSGQMIERK